MKKTKKNLQARCAWTRQAKKWRKENKKMGRAGKVYVNKAAVQSKKKKRSECNSELRHFYPESNETGAAIPSSVGGTTRDTY